MLQHSGLLHVSQEEQRKVAGLTIYIHVMCSSGHVRFIDYEYSSYNYQAFDIGNHFNEFAGLSKGSMMYTCE